VKNGREHRQEYRILDNGSDAVLVEFLDPQQKGMRVLSVGGNMWFYAPRTRRVIKIPPIQRVFGEASYGDITQIRLSTDYEPDGAPCVMSLDGQRVLRVRLTAREEGATYATVMLWMDAENHLPLRMDYHVASGKHIKTAEFPNAQIINGKVALGTWRLFNPDNRDSVTLIETLSYKVMNIPARRFTRRALESGR